MGRPAVHPQKEKRLAILGRDDGLIRPERTKLAQSNTPCLIEEYMYMYIYKYSLLKILP